MHNKISRVRVVVFACLMFAVFAAASWTVVSRVSAVPAESYEDFKIFTDVIGIVESSYTDEVDTQELIYGAVKGMLRGLDPHSSFLTPADYKEMQVDTKGSFGGIGIEIGLRDDVLTVISPIEDTPAFRAGLEAGDLIVKIEDQSTKDMSLMDAVKLMRGKKGTPLTIWIMRKGFTEPKEVDLVRAIIKIQSIKHRELEEGYGYVRVTQFQERTDRDLEKALNELGSRKGELKGLVLDLRNNPGGLLKQAAEVSDKFLSEGLIVYTKGRVPGQDMEFAARKKGTHPEYPIIVLVNGGSASASEIVAGALQDHKRGIVLGTQTFGKGSVQTIIPLQDGSAVRLTTAKYYTPSGRSIQAKGIEPDIVVGKTYNGRLKEKDLKGHLKGDGEGALDKKDKDKEKKSSVDDDGDDEELPLKSAKAEDIQLERALDYLKSWYIFKGTIEKKDDGGELKEAI